MKRRILTDARIASMTGNAPYGLIDNGALAMENGRIVWVGSDIPEIYADWPQEPQGGRLITPGLIDCHTHIVFGGNRAREFEMRLDGATYEEIARAGGGIMSTVTATRVADQDALLADALPRLDAMIGEGVTTVEVKSGYGLDVETELRMLRTARELATKRRVRIITSFLGAHAVPAEYLGRADAYLEDVCVPALRKAHTEGLVDAVDGFCEDIAFNNRQIQYVFNVSNELGLPVKLHAEQLSNTGGTRLAARNGALSADHVEYATETDAKALAKAGSVAVVLPGAFYTLRETRVPPIKAFRAHGVPMALATDCNPGSSPMASLLLAMNMGCTLFGMTPEEALRGVTQHAARALGVKDIGRIAAGLKADLAIWNVVHPAELAYRIGFNPLHKRIFGGV